ncbi:alkylglycerol monooxygenase-like [Acipenser ruthenus]|uniref:alkylglycerol monooxygenase-like n=1 Tax=Acipenser ruthenus TaxID=7906 RepID=UPI00145B9233|nr:alkylglycerol monooxygenase-like [Acipenser ruthenus]
MAVHENPAVSLSQGIRMMFYVMTPNETAFRNEEEVPDYVQQATPLFIGMLVLEFLLSWVKNGRAAIRVNDGITSLSAGVLSRLPGVLAKSVELSTYIYVWNNYRLLELPWDSPWTWWLTFLGVDFGYYWVHRLSHEVNIMWAAHQVHHSSEDYNLTTALRQSLTQQYASWLFYLPMALLVPPSVFAVHLQFNLLYQFWIHTELVSNLGPVELVMNTPSHHRVHHGRNSYCIDKNYAGTLIIWDRIFGTFAPEREKVIYGLTHPINTFEVLWVQFQHYVHIWNTLWDTPGITNKLSVIFKGPGWGPGKPRLGLPEELPEITGKEVPHNPSIPVALQAYVMLQFLLMLGIYHEMFATKAILSQITLLLRIGYITLTLTCFGFLIDQRPDAAIWESIRCLTFLAFHRFGYVKMVFASLAIPTEMLFLLCTVYWGSLSRQAVAKAKHH